MRLVAYTRVSTRTQVEDGLGLAIQEQVIRRYAKRDGHRLVAWCSDEGVSGANGLDQRDGLAEALALIRDGRADGLVVYRLDRLARDVIVQEQLLAEVWRLGGEVLSTASGEADLRDDPDDPSRRMIRVILGAVAEYERSMVVLRLRRGRVAKSERGEYAYGSPRYGQRAEDGALVDDPAEQAAIARVAELHRGGASLRSIAATLTAEGCRPKRSDRWHPMKVKAIVDRL